MTTTVPADVLTDPLKFKALCWPQVSFYDKQIDIIYSVRDNDETFAPAGNMLGKDYVAGFVCIWFFMSRNPCRIITTSAKDDHLRVLWGEINNFILSSRFPLDAKRGGPLVINHHDIRKVLPNGERCPKSYLKGMVASSDAIAAMQGHHVAQTGDGVPRTLFVADEASSVPQDYWKMAVTWMNRALVIGNTWPCENFFKWACKGRPGTKDKGGDLPKNDGTGTFYRKVIRIKAEDSPNVRLATEEKKLGYEPSGRIIIAGVKPYAEYVKNRLLWDPIQCCVSLDADWYEGAEVKLYPAEWLNRSESLDVGYNRKKRRYMGVDVAEGGDDTVWTVIDEQGILYQEAERTADTAVIPNKTIALMGQWGVRPEDVLFDRGGGGYEHVCTLRSRGRKYAKIRAVGFGESAKEPFIQRRQKTVGEREEVETIRYVYKNRRAEMYGILRSMLDPEQNPSGFNIPAKYTELRRQLAPLPLLFDEEGRLYLPPKNKKDPNSKTLTLKEILGCSPDESDSLVLACFGLERIRSRIKLQVAR